MKASELITKLQSQIDNFGDLDVEGKSVQGTHPIETVQSNLFTIQIIIK